MANQLNVTITVVRLTEDGRFASHATLDEKVSRSGDVQAEQQKTMSRDIV